MYISKMRSLLNTRMFYQTIVAVETHLAEGLATEKVEKSLMDL
jgi:hypothetical protein